jgi:hypothetical protein
MRNRSAIHCKVMAVSARSLPAPIAQYQELNPFGGSAIPRTDPFGVDCSGFGLVFHSRLSPCAIAALSTARSWQFPRAACPHRQYQELTPLGSGQTQETARDADRLIPRTDPFGRLRFGAPVLDQVLHDLKIREQPGSNGFIVCHAVLDCRLRYLNLKEPPD